MKNNTSKGFYLVAFFLILFHPFLSFAQKPSSHRFSTSIGFGRSKLVHDSLSLEPSFLPAISFDYLNIFNEKAQLFAGLRYSIIGGNNISPIKKLQNHYLGVAIGPRYYPLDFLFVELNLQYSQLLFQWIKVLDGSSPNGMKRNEGIGYHSQLEFITAMGIKLQDGMHFRLNYTIPYSNIEYQNLQFMASFDLSSLKIPQKKTKYKSFSKALSESNSCQRLIIHRKELTDLSPEIKSLVNLQELFLDGNLLKALPPDICELKFLTKISVRHNKLTEVPNELIMLGQLEELYLDYNRLTTLPDEIGQLKNLRFLHLGNNYLSELPSSIGQLTNLIELDVSNNMALLRLPVEIENLRNLELLIVDRSTLFPIPFILPNARLQIIIRD